MPGVTWSDFIVRGEGEITFRELLRAIETRSLIMSAFQAYHTG